MKLLKCLSILFLSAPLFVSCQQGHKHSYDFENGKWFWSETETGYAASYTVFCDKCDEEEDGHRLELEASIDISVNEPTCVHDGVTIYTASVEYGKKTYTDTKLVSIEATGHQYTSMTVEGDYPKTYHAFDQFDDSGLTVKAVCGACEDEFVIPHDEYFIVYNVFGMDHLSVGDTSVAISYHGQKVVLDGLTVTPITVNVPAQDTSSFTYDGEEKVYAVQESEYYTVTGNRVTNAGDYDVVISLKDKTNYVWSSGGNEDIIYHFTVNKAANEITGFLDSYNTTCGIHPDFSGVTSTANDLVVTYYRDAAMTDEVQESELSVGNYYLKAISGGANYVQVVKTATLTVSHSFEHEVQEEKYIKTAATEDENAVYYKSCACSLASSTATFVAEGTKLPSLIATSSYEPSEIVNEAAPEGYSMVSKGTISYTQDPQGNAFLNNIDIKNYSTVRYAFKTMNRRFCDSNWDNPIPVNVWHFVTITKNNDGTYKAVIKNAAGSILIYNNSATSFRNTFPYYNWDGDQPFMDWYSTEVLGIKLDPVGTFVAASSVSPYDNVGGPSPLGYNSVTKKTLSYADGTDPQGKPFLNNIDISAYASVFFAFKTANRAFCHYPTWGSALTIGEWYFVTITNNNDGTYTSVIKDGNGTTKFGYENKASFADSLIYCHYDGPTYMDWYSTEVRGILK